MAVITNYDSIDFKLLEQYFELIGADSTRESLMTLQKILPDYIAEAEMLAAQQDETNFRRQAHKIKGGCRSLGFSRLGQQMEFLERESWDWEQAEAALAQCRSWLPEDLQSVQNWLYMKTK